jgi:hypothetical protein
VNPSELQFSGTRDEKGEIKISAVPAMNPKEHQYIKFDKESPSHRALLSASADKEHPNYVEGLAIHSGGMFSVPKAATRKPHEKALYSIGLLVMLWVPQKNQQHRAQSRQ